MSVKKKYNALGRGLDVLLSSDDVRPQGSSTINEVPIAEIAANPNQPRREFDNAALQELANSIREIGIVQPITLRQMADGSYQIIAGERRWRASQLAGLTTIPAYIRTISDESVMEMALVENIQREDLNPIEIALAYAHLLEHTGMTQEKVAERVGKSRVAVTNYLRLLKLPAQVQMELQRGGIDMGHARALLSIDSPSLQLKVFRDIQKRGCSVRQVEEIVKRLKAGDEIVLGKKAVKADVPSEYDSMRKRLQSMLKVSVDLKMNRKGAGKITIPFGNADELQKLMEMFGKMKK